MEDDSTAGAVKTKNPSPLVYDKEKNKECKFEEATTSDENNKDKDCRKTVIYVDSDGYIRNADIKIVPIENLDIGLVIEKINAIVLHRTQGPSASSAINNYKTDPRKYGSHFVIDKNGEISQTFSLKKVVQHVGPIRPKCVTEQTVTPEELKKINAIHDYEELRDYEKEKPYPTRYPWSGDSVGIEVASRCINKSKGIWEAATEAEKAAVNRLVDIIMNIYELSTSDIYEHDQISRKTAGEGADLYTAKDYEHSTKNLKAKGQWVNVKGAIVRNK